MAFDTLIRGAQVLDGTGKPAFPADVALSGGKIAAVGALPDAEAENIVEAAGRILTPGFIDVHRHADAALFRKGFGGAELAQGLTTIINGNCGFSLAPIAGSNGEATKSYLAPILGETPRERRFASLERYLAATDKLELPLNHGTLIGMGTLRTSVTGFAGGDLDVGSLRMLHRLLEGALADGALGVSLGLGYAPECFYTTAGLIRALEPLRGSGVLLTVHLRQEGEGVVDALREMLSVAKELRAPMQVSHLKAIGRVNWRKNVPEMLRLIAQAREDGLDVTCDVYPYTAGSTQLIHVLPPEFQCGGTAALATALRDPETRQEMRRRMETGVDFENITHLVGFENVRAKSLQQPENISYEDLSIAEIASLEKKDSYDALFDLLADENCTPAMIDFISDEEDVEEILRAPFSGVISDATYPAKGLPHPRVYGAFTRLLETYVRKKGVLSLEEAVHKITQQPAERFGLKGKGVVAAGADADLCLFDLERVHETATFQDPRRLAEGMDLVWVGGRPAFRSGAKTGYIDGKSLRRGR